MLYKNITFAVSVIIVAICSTVISTTYYKWQTPDYSYLSEYENAIAVNISDGVSIENIDDLYYTAEGQVFTQGGWKYSHIYIKSFRKGNLETFADGEPIFSLNGKRLKFNYEIVVIDDDLSVSSDSPAKFRVIAKDEYVSGSLDFELYTHDALCKQYVLKSMPINFVIALALDLLICIVFAIVDYKRDDGLYNLFLLLPDFHLFRRKPIAISAPSSSAENVSTTVSSASANGGVNQKSAKVKEYEAKYDLTKNENAVFKEIAYNTLSKLFVDDVPDDETEECVEKDVVEDDKKDN